MDRYMKAVLTVIAIALVWLCLRGSGPVSFGTSAYAAGQAKTAAPQDIHRWPGFEISEVRFDESIGTKRPLPVIPRSWRFVAVSNGEKTNANNLWFQDGDGNIYVVRGFTTYGTFILSDSVQKISVGK